MSKKSLISVFSLVLFIITLNIIRKVVTGQPIEFIDIISIGVFSMFLLFTLTWGNRGEKNGIFQDEELGQKIVESASKISYTILYFLIMGAVLGDKLVNGDSNIFLLAVFVLAMLVFPVVQFFVSRRYI